MSISSIQPIQNYTNPLSRYLSTPTFGLFPEQRFNANSSKAFSAFEKGFADAAKLIDRYEPSSLSLHMDSYVKSLFTSTQNKEYILSAAVSRSGTNKKYSVIESYLVQGKESASSLASTESLTATKTNGKGEQITALNQQKAVTSNAKFDLSKTISSNVAVDAYKKANVSVQQTNITSQTNQAAQGEANTVINTATKKTVTNTNAKGNVSQPVTTERKVQEEINTNWNQVTGGIGNRNVTQEVSSNKLKEGNATVTLTQIDTKDVRANTAEITTNAQTNYTAEITTTGQNGKTVTQDINRLTNSDEKRNIETQEVIATQRDIAQIAQGQQSITVDTTKQTDKIAQMTTADAATKMTNLGANGNIVSIQNTETQTVSTLNKTSDTDVERLITRGQTGVEGLGSLTVQSKTSIETDITATNAAGKVTTRDIDRTIASEQNMQWSGSIQENKTEGAGKAFNLSNLEVGSLATKDVTTEGKNETKVTTNNQSEKEVNGSINYTPAEQVNRAQNAPNAGIAVNFGVYSGLASGFKLDTGEVQFNLSFASAEINTQTVSQEVSAGEKNQAVNQTKTESGQMNNASLSGTLTSTITDDGSRLIKVTATYKSEGAKYVAENGTEKQAAGGKQETNVQIEGSMLISKEGNTKSISSEFDISKIENSQAKGTGAEATGQALAQDDALRKSLSFDNGVFKFNLGFASLNFSVYA